MKPEIFLLIELPLIIGHLVGKVGTNFSLCIEKTVCVVVPSIDQRRNQKSFFLFYKGNEHGWSYSY